MSALTEKETAALRALLVQRYGLDLQEKITRVEFISPQKTGAYFHVYDSFQPPRPPQTEYVVEIHTPGGEKRKMQFKKESTMETAYASFIGRGYSVFAYVNGTLKKKYSASKPCR